MVEKPDARTYFGCHKEYTDAFLADIFDMACCTGGLEANLDAQVIGVARIGWMS